MSRGAWVRSEPDQAHVVFVPMTDDVQRERWYQAWAVLAEILARIEAAEPICVIETEVQHA